MYKPGYMRYPYLLNGHDDLNGIQAVQTEVVREVRGTVDLLNRDRQAMILYPREIPANDIGRHRVSKLTLLASETCNNSSLSVTVLVLYFLISCNSSH